MRPRAFQIFLCVILLPLASWHDARAQEVGAGLPLVPAEIPQNLRPIQLHSEDGANFFFRRLQVCPPITRAGR
jgi:hypothetical protein